MPNWCHNKLKVDGDGDLVEAFALAEEVDVEGTKVPLTFSNDVPEPGDPESYDWYSWRVENWGTKWEPSFDGPFLALGDSEADVDTTVLGQGRWTLGDGALLYVFDTAWSPPVPWLDKVAALYPALEFTLRFGEVGNGFAGECRYEDGSLVADTELDIDEVLAPHERWF